MTDAAALRALPSPPKVFLAATGAGAGLQAALWSVPGSSAFLVGAAFPYAAHETERLLGFRPAHFCDEEAAVELAIAAYLRARESVVADATAGAAIGLGLTASVASLTEHRGDHRIFVATLSDDGAVVWSARLPKGTGEARRAADGAVADRLGMHALLAAAGIARDEVPPIDVSRRALSETELRAIVYRHPTFGPGDARAAALPDARDVVLLPGSFDPFHDGHLMMADAVERQHGRRVVYTLTADPVHKAQLRVVDLLDRVASIRDGDLARPVLLTERDPLFIDKARRFPGAGIVLGVDALLRMLDPSWGPNIDEMFGAFRALGTRFYVIGRNVAGRWTTLADAPIPEGLRALFHAVDGRRDVSSTELRRRDDLRAPE